MRSAQGGEPVSVLDRIIAILEVVRESHGSTTITQLALATGIPKSTVSRLVGDLVRTRYLMRSDGGVAIGLDSSSSGRARAPRVASGRCASRAGGAVQRHRRAPQRRRAGGTRHALGDLGRGRLRPAPSRAGVRVPSVTTALGKAVLAFTADESMLRGIMTDLDPARPPTARAGARRCAQLRGGDRSLRDVPWVIGVASPILSPERVPVAAISVAGRRSTWTRPGWPARAARRAGAHAPTGAAGGLIDARRSRADSFGVLDRMTAIFEAFDEDDRGLRISELAARAGLPKSTVSRLVSTLVRQRLSGA